MIQKETNVAFRCAFVSGSTFPISVISPQLALWTPLLLLQSRHGNNFRISLKIFFFHIEHDDALLSLYFCDKIVHSFCSY